MESRGNIGKLPVITLVVVVGAFAVIAAVLYYNTLLERRLSEVDAGLSKLNATVDRLRHNLEIAQEEIQLKDETIEVLQQEISEQEKLRTGRSAQKQAWIASLISDLQPKVDPVVADTIAGSIYRYSRKYGIPPELIVNVAMRESSFRLILESNKKARGLMQVMATAHPEKLEKLDVNNDTIFHIDNNIHLGTMILAEYYESRNSIYSALEAYVGAELKNYINDILVGFTDTKIRQFRAATEEEIEEMEGEAAGEEIEKMQSEGADQEESGEPSTGDEVSENTEKKE